MGRTLRRPMELVRSPAIWSCLTSTATAQRARRGNGPIVESPGRRTLGTVTVLCASVVFGMIGHR